MTHEILDAPGLADDLATRMRRLEVRTTQVFGQALPMAATVYAAGRDFLRRLQGQLGPEAARHAADVLQHELIDPAELATPAFWASGLGRAIGFWTGGCERFDEGRQLGVPQVEAAALLKMSRQGVNANIGSKRLEQVGPGLGVTAASVAELMHTRYPLSTAETLEDRRDGADEAA